MIIYIGADHRGFELKEALKEFLKDDGYTVKDMGNDHLDPEDDYPKFAKAVCEQVSADITNRKGVLICGSGVGMDIIANRYSLIRSVLAISPDQVMASRNDDDTNIITIAADFFDFETVKRLVSVWNQTPFSNAEEDKRRLQFSRDLGTF